ncbi:hypothetical protein SCG7109_AI_00270 [Chlamydiales bacterium SCGC AG-110-M15]|nr:hypothetical protein SCG7109_AI_00270 [Chlamydiales bacterium SCGC AG-110-M15]
MSLILSFLLSFQFQFTLANFNPLPTKAVQEHRTPKKGASPLKPLIKYRVPIFTNA